MKNLVFLNLLFLVSCTSVFYHPSKKTFFDVNQKEIFRHDIHIMTEDGLKLHGWHFPSQKNGKKTPSEGLVLYFHGNAQNITSHFLNLLWLTENQYDYLLFDYRGYGKSEGVVENNKMLLDIKAMVEKGQKLAKQNEVPFYLYGQSLGGTLLLKYLSLNPEVKFDDLIIEGSFFSFQEIAELKAESMWITWPFQWLIPILISDRNSLNKEDLLKIPGSKIVFHSEKDYVVPLSQGRKIYSNLSEPKVFWPHTYKTHMGGSRVADGLYQKKILSRWQNK